LSERVYACFSFATVRVAPIPAPVLSYQACPVGSTLIEVQIAFSLVFVPLSSPREMNKAPESAIAWNASAAVALPATPAGSSAGPTITKKLYINGIRVSSKPSPMNFSSCDLECTRRMSASPVRPFSIAAPVPAEVISSV